MTGPDVPRFRGLTTLVATAAVVAIAALPQALAKPKGEQPSQSNGNHDPGEGSCDVDGVAVDWHSGFYPGPPVQAYGVHQVTVSGISGTCSEAGSQATLRVWVTDGSDPRATASTPVPVGDHSVTVTLDRVPRAEDVVHVDVELAGGRVPVPAECESMTFDNITLGTTGDDRLVLTQRRNLTFGLTGDDEIRAQQQDDCLLGQDGADRLFAGNGKDVVLGGDGADHLHGEGGKDELHGGPGDDVIDGGHGKDVCYGGPGVDTFIDCETAIQ